MIGGSFIYLSLYAVNQAQVQRLLTLPTLRKAQSALVFQVGYPLSIYPCML